MTETFISIIIPMFNAEKTIGACLDSISGLEYDHGLFEVIVVDNGSTDDSVNIVSGYPVRLLFQPDGTISSVRNFGADHARGEIFAFVDSDCIVDAAWLKNGMSILQNPKAGAAGSGYLTPRNFTWVEKAWLYESKHPPFATTFLPGGNLMVKAPVFHRINGFDEALTTGEDSDLCVRINKLGFTVMNSSDIKCVHLGNAKTIAVFFRKECWYGMNMIDELLNHNCDRTFVMTCTFIACMAVFVYGLFSLPGGTYSLVLLPATVIALICTVSACYRLSRSKKYRYFIELNLLYFVYYLARSSAVLRSLFLRYAK